MFFQTLYQTAYTAKWGFKVDLNEAIKNATPKQNVKHVTDDLQDSSV
jgi:hypothetical protein